MVADRGGLSPSSSTSRPTSSRWRRRGAKVVEREQAPELHDMVERLCAMADLPKPRIAVIERTCRTRSRPAAARSTPPSP